MIQQNSELDNDTSSRYTSEQDLELMQLKIELTLLRYELLSNQGEDRLNLENYEQEKIRL